MNEKTSFTIHDLPKPERPRERLKRFGPEALSAHETFHIIISKSAFFSFKEKGLLSRD